MGNQRDSLGDRMKRYEYVSRNYLTRRVPVIIRIDGKAFHTFTKGMRKPFDRVLMSAMQETMRFLCANIQGCVFGYTQSDEITLVLTDYASIRTDAWFGYNVQKMCSIAASMATLAFNKAFAEQTEKEDSGIDLSVYRRKFQTAMFDARAFTVPLDEVCNCLIWRQQDATRNSIEAVGQANFSQRELHGKNCNKIQDMLWKERNINWNDFPTDCKRGSCCIKTRITEAGSVLNGDATVEVSRSRWVVDREPPVFTQDREYGATAMTMEEKVQQQEIMLHELMEKNRESKRELAAYHNIMQGMVGSANERIDRLEIIVETAITKAVHELIERLRYDDIQAIDEEEFAAAVRKLIFDADPGVQLPF